MAHSNGIITAPVSFGDVNATIGTAHTDLGSLCVDNNINIWAKYKPVRYPNLNTIDQYDFTQGKWKSTATWWKGVGTDFGGLTPKEVASLSLLKAAYDGNMNGWVYNKPQGGANQPYRLTDFAQYDHNAPAAIQNFYMAPTVVQGGRFFADALLSMPNPNGLYISIGDFESMSYGQLYFGVAFFYGDTMVCRLTATEVATAGVEGDFNGAQTLVVGRNYTVYPFFCNKQLYLTDTGETAGTKWWSCPNVNPVTVSCVSGQSQIDVVMEAEYVSGSLTNISVKITGDSSRQLTNCRWYIIPTDYWASPDTSQAVQSSSIFTIDANEVKTWSTTVTAGNYFLYATFNTGQYNRKTSILQPLPPQQR